MVCLVAIPSIGNADCLEDRHAVAFDGGIVQFRSFTCQVSGAPLRVEFHRLGTLPASILVAHQTSERLDQVIGRPRIIENEVSATFLSLLRQFGSAIDSSGKIIRFAAEAGGAGGSVNDVRDTVGWSAARVLGRGGFYPALEESGTLQARILPPGMKYFYSVSCKDGSSDSSKPVCRNFDPSFTRMRFWRSMRQSDVADYPRRMRAYNARYMAGDFKLPVVAPATLRLISYLAGERWPDDFAILFGTADSDGCDSGFSFSMPVIMLEFALLENTSSRPLTIDGIFGGRSGETRLRIASASASNLLAVTGNTLSESVGTLAVGEKVLVPLRIILGPDQSVTDAFGYRQTASELNRRLGTSGFSGNAGAFAAPSQKTYVYGPEVAIGGLSVNGSRVDLAKRSANFMEITMSSEEGSCPHLLSWDEYRSDWVDHGKVLDKAPSSDREYTELKVFSGFKGRFRLEEREPEIAFIDQTALTILLDSGRIMALKPTNPKLAERDGDLVRIPWGDKIESVFTLPDGVSVEQVKESRFAVTGYYVRYSNLSAQAAAVSAGLLDGARKSKISAKACPIPARY
jgi:hypothetical protein